jgi:hypothetical protein
MTICSGNFTVFHIPVWHILLIFLKQLNVINNSFKYEFAGTRYAMKSMIYFAIFMFFNILKHSLVLVCHLVFYIVYIISRE